VSNEDLALQVHVDWNTAPARAAKGNITVTQEGALPFVVPLRTLRLPTVTRENAEGFVESDGYVAIEAADTTGLSADSATHWQKLPGYGETRSAMTVFPVTAPSNMSSQASLQYRMYLYDTGSFTMQTILAPTLNFVPGRGLRFAVSIDDGPRTVVDVLEHNTQNDWQQAVSDGVRKVSIPLTIGDAGYHTLKIWMVDPGVVLERIVLEYEQLLPSYLGPPGSFHGNAAPDNSSSVQSKAGQ